MNRSYLPLLLLALLIVTGCTSSEFHHEYASGHTSSDIEQCALYARKVSGVQLYGDAYRWWGEAPPRYQRGHTPAPGAILVLKRTERMHSGHVAVVKNIVGPRQINVTHSNWGSGSSSRHIIYESMRVDDVSPANNWTQLRFWNDDKNVLGFPYEAYGFIYP